MHAIIAENDISKWNDETGVKYHFPNKYKRILQPGTKVIYYKGGVTHYFGYAVIGDVYQDVENAKNYYAEIVDYIPFQEPIPFKTSNGEHLEEKIKSNHWRDGVRIISEERFNKILKLSGIITEAIPFDEPLLEPSFFPPVNEVMVSLADSSLVTTSRPKKKNGSLPNNSSPKYSRNATNIGNQGEALVMDYLAKTLHKEEAITLRHHAKENEKYGYDISYTNLLNEKIYIEVKATTAALFNNFVITINELAAAQEFGPFYKIYLVNNVTSKDVKIEVIEDIAKLIKEKSYMSTAISFKIEKVE